MGFCWVGAADIYNTNQVQAMLIFLKNHPAEKKAFLDGLLEDCCKADARAIKCCVEEHYYGEFDRYDSAVCDYFIRRFERMFIKNKKYNKTKKLRSEFLVVDKAGDEYGVVDLTDYAIDYVTQKEILSIVRKGIYIEGVNANGKIMVY